MARTAFLQPSVLRPTTLSQPRAVCRRRPVLAPVRACAAEAAPEAADSLFESEDLLHKTWKVYSEPGNKCVVCLGEGKTKCLYCFGEGIIRIGPEPGRDTITCPLCEGTGTVICPRCDGTGIRPATRIDLETGEVVRNLTNEEVCNLPTQAEVEAAAAEKEAAEATTGAADGETPTSESSQESGQRSESVVQ